MTAHLRLYTAQQHDEHYYEARSVLAVYAVYQYGVVDWVHKYSQRLCHLLLALHQQAALVNAGKGEKTDAW